MMDPDTYFLKDDDLSDAALHPGRMIRWQEPHTETVQKCVATTIGRYIICFWAGMVAGVLLVRFL